jgi:hypothetical protein
MHKVGWKSSVDGLRADEPCDTRLQNPIAIEGFIEAIVHREQGCKELSKCVTPKDIVFISMIRIETEFAAKCSLL